MKLIIYLIVAMALPLVFIGVAVLAGRMADKHDDKAAK